MKNLLLHPTPIGTVGIVENGRAITDILFEEQLPGHAVRHTTLLLERAAKQLDEYFAGKRTSFDLPLEPEGTPYRKKVWQVLTEIPYGQTMTYGEIARRTGNPQASRAVGGANHHNPIPIVIPCHRVIGAGGKLTGYAGGLVPARPRKEQAAEIKNEGRSENSGLFRRLCSASRRLEHIFAYAAKRAAPIVGQIFESGAGSDAAVRITDRRVIDVVTNCATILFHSPKIFRLSETVFLQI